jgi:hypothetical protein
VRSSRLEILLLSLGLCAGCAHASSPSEGRIPEIRETLTDGSIRPVEFLDYTWYQELAIAEIASHPLDELFALEVSYPGRGPGGVVEIVVRPQQSFVRALAYEADHESLEPVGQRELTESELGALRRFVAGNQIDHLPRQEFGGWDGVEYRWTHLSQVEGWQVLLNNPTASQHPQQELLELMKRLQNTKPIGGETGIEVPIIVLDD